jgi:hypothetical protein
MGTDVEVAVEVEPISEAARLLMDWLAAACMPAQRLENVDWSC